MDPTNPARTAGEVAALKEYEDSCRELAVAANVLREAQEAYYRALNRYEESYRAARAAKVVP
jgi:hypothetical protein